MISIIIPTYNEEKHLLKLLKSIKKQDFKDYEIIVSDANSKDKTVKIAKKYGCKVIKGGLPSIGRNNGAKFAKYERIVFLDADVIISRGFIINCLRAMDKKNLGVASVLSKPDSNKFIDRFLFALWNFWVWSTQKIYPHAPGYCIFSSKTIHNKINGFDPKLVLGEDSNYVLRASKAAKFGIIPVEIKTSVRRLDTEGRWKLFKKLVHCGVYRMIKGEPEGNKFDYNFGIHNNKKSKPSD